MIFKIKTSKKTMNLFEELTASTSYAPFILAKLAISMSLKSKTRIANKHSNTHCNLMYGYDIIKKQVKVPVSSFFVYITIS